MCFSCYKHSGPVINMEDCRLHAWHAHCWTHSLSVFQWSHQTQSASVKKNSIVFIIVPMCFSCYKHSGPVINMENYVVLSCRNVYMCVYWNDTLKCRFNKCFNLFIYLTMITYRQRVHILDDHSFGKTSNTY
jgi:hypothetical protein